MAEVTKSNPLGIDEDQLGVVANALIDLKHKVMALPNSREKSVILTKCDEIRHWLTDAKAAEDLNKKIGELFND